MVNKFSILKCLIACSLVVILISCATIKAKDEYDINNDISIHDTIYILDLINNTKTTDKIIKDLKTKGLNSNKLVKIYSSDLVKIYRFADSSDNINDVLLMYKINDVFIYLKKTEYKYHKLYIEEELKGDLSDEELELLLSFIQFNIFWNEYN